MLDLRLTIEDSPVGDGYIKIRCLNPTHKDRSPAMAVYPDHIHCFACGFDVQGLAALALLLKLDEGEALAQYRKYTVESLDSYRERATEHAKSNPLPMAHAVLFHRQLASRFKERLEWFKEERGLNDQTIEKHLIGHNGLAFTIPIFDDEGRLISFRYRADPAYNTEEYVKQHKYSGMQGRNGLYLYPAPLIAADTRDWIVLCEGEFDALRLWQEGIPAASLTNGAGQCKKLPALLPKRIKTVYIATDQDEAGEIAADEVAVEADRLGLFHTRITWPEGKDVTEAYKLGWRVIE
jgi:DNA primase